MLKGILAGMVAGALVTAVALKAFASRRTEAPVERAEVAAADSTALKARADALRADNEALRKALSDGTAELASLEKKEGGGGKKKKRKAGEKTWKELAPLLRKAFGGEGGDRESKEMQAAQLDFMALVARIAKKHGMSMDEAMSAPDGLPQLLRALLETGDPPGTPEQLAKVDALIEQYAKDWEKARAGGGGESRLERRLAIGELADGYMQGVLDAMTAEQRASNRNFEMFGGMSEGMGGGQHYANGTREAVVTDLSAQWAKVMKLDKEQASQLAPYVESFMADYESLQKSVRPEGERDINYWKRLSREQVRAQIRAQQAMADGLNLTPAQRKALLDSGMTVQFWVEPPPDKSPDPAPTDGE